MHSEGSFQEIAMLEKKIQKHEIYIELNRLITRYLQ